MQVLQVSMADRLGGAERIAMLLHKSLCKNGHDSHLCVGWKYTSDDSVTELCPDHDNELWKQFFIEIALGFEKKRSKKWLRFAGKMARALGDPTQFMRWWTGQEEFNFRKTEQILSPHYEKYRIVHLHNLHGGYFDLRLLPRLCEQHHVVVTLHDEWLFTGHCACSMDCLRWQENCGHCPYLETYPAIRIDNTEANLRRKKAIYNQSLLSIATPSKWLMNRLEQSILAGSVQYGRVIPNGVDTDVFCPADKIMARRKLGLDENACIFLFMANYFKTNPFKDFSTVLQAINLVSQKLRNRKMVLVAVGEDARIEHVDKTEILVRPYVDDQEVTACYFQAADIYLHAAYSETWGLTITEAMSAGVPVIATRTGGIPEQVISLDMEKVDAKIEQADAAATGILVEQQDSIAMAEAICLLLENQQLRKQLGENGSRRVANNYSLQHMFSAYIDFYNTVLEEHAA